VSAQERPESGEPAAGGVTPGAAGAAASAPAGAATEAAETHRLVLTLVERDGGVLAATLRRFQGLPLPDGALDEAWHWLAHVRVSRGLTASTTARYLEVLGRFLVYVRAKGLDWRQLSLADIDAWQRHLAFARHNAESWRATQLMALRNFYGWHARFRGGRDCVADVQGPRFVRRKRRKYSRKDLAAMFATCAGQSPMAVRDRAMMLFLLATGARREECAHLRLDQLDLGERRAVVRFLGKGRKERDVSFAGPAVDALREWLLLRDQLPKSNVQRVWVSLSSSGKGHPLTMNGVEHVVARAAKRAALAAWGCHRFRVTFATWLYDDGHDIDTIARLLGHEDINTTRAYLDVSERAHRAHLDPRRQHDLLGTKPLVPRWLDRKLQQPRRGPDAPSF
jgi:integrase/recombinase XerD